MIYIFNSYYSIGGCFESGKTFFLFCLGKPLLKTQRVPRAGLPTADRRHPLGSHPYTPASCTENTQWSVRKLQRHLQGNIMNYSGHYYRFFFQIYFSNSAIGILLRKKKIRAENIGRQCEHQQTVSRGIRRPRLVLEPNLDYLFVQIVYLIIILNDHNESRIASFSCYYFLL